jgi:hypothetical protein
LFPKFCSSSVDGPFHFLVSDSVFSQFQILCFHIFPELECSSTEVHISHLYKLKQQL